jgi:hypothetical protein
MSHVGYCRNLTLKECEDDTHTLEMGTWESSGTPKNSELDYRVKNTSPWGVFYTVEKSLKRRCWKWPRMSHLDICSTSLCTKERPRVKLAVWLSTTKSQKLTWPQWVQVECDTSLESSQGELQVFLDLIPIGGLSKELWAAKVLRVQTGTVSKFLFGSPGKKCHLDVGVTK